MKLVPVGSPYDGDKESNARKRYDTEEAILERQFDIYQKRADGVPLRDLAREYQVSFETVVSDIGTEGKRRALALGDTLGERITMSVMRYEGVIARARTRLDLMEAARAALSITKGSAVLPRSSAMFEDRVIIEAQKRIDDVLGLTVRVPGGVSLSGADANEVTTSALLDAFAGLSMADRLEVLRRVRERRLEKSAAPSENGAAKAS